MTDLVKHQFPHPTLTALSNDRPTPQTLLLLHQELNTNAISVPSARGDGELGHFALVVPLATYLASSNNIPFVPPVHPGVAPIIPLNATAAIITETNRQYTYDLNEAATYNSVHNNLKKQLLEAVPSTYIIKLRNSTLGYAKVSVLSLLEHLDTTYGVITSDDLNVNLKNLNRVWSGTQPLEDLWAQIDACRTFAAIADPISEATAVRSALINLENSGLFSDAIRDWRKLPPVDWTLPQLQTHFNLADTERKRLLTTQTAGYHGHAHAAVRNVAPSPPAAPPGLGIPTSLYYCWSHGLGPNAEHTSATCKFPVANHRTDATMYNMLGGCNVVHRRRGETGIYVRPVNPARNSGTAAAATDMNSTPPST